MGTHKFIPSKGGGSGTDEKAKVSSNDTTAGYLNGKLVAGTGVTLTENNNGGDETLEVDLDAATIASLALANSALQSGDNVSELTNDAGYITDISGFDTDDLSEGATNKYFTDERAQDAAASMLTQGSRMSMSYNDGANTYTIKSVDTEYKTLTIGEGTDELLVNTRGKFMFVPENYTLTGWRLHEASETPISGSIVIDIRTGSTYAGSTSIAGTEKPTLSSANNNSDTSLSSWTTSLTSGTFVWFNIDSVTDCKKVILALEMVKT